MKPKHLLALGVLVVCFTATASLSGAQKSAPPQPTEQQKLKELVDTIESQLKEAQAKADRAAMEKDYIERIQKEVNAYYEKAFATQIVVVAIIGLIVGLVGKFGVDHIIQSKLTEASTTLRQEFTKTLNARFAELEKSHADHLKSLDQELRSEIKTQVHRLELLTTYIYGTSQVISAGLAGQNQLALTTARTLIPLIVKERQAFPAGAKIPENTVKLLFLALGKVNPKTFADEAKKELRSPLYNELGPELNSAAIDIPELVQVLKESREDRPSPAKS